MATRARFWTPFSRLHHWTQSPDFSLDFELLAESLDELAGEDDSDLPELLLSADFTSEAFPLSLDSLAACWPFLYDSLR